MSTAVPARREAIMMVGCREVARSVFLPTNTSATVKGPEASFRRLAGKLSGVFSGFDQDVDFS